MSDSLFTEIDTEMQSDSVAYSKFKLEFLAHQGNSEMVKLFIEAADGLAQEGLFSEALSLLKETVPTDLSEELSIDEDYDSLDFDELDKLLDTLTLPEMNNKQYTWLLNANGSYYNNLFYFKQDTATDTSSVIETKDDLFDIHAAFEWRPDSSLFEKIEPYLYISNNRGKVGSDVDLSFFKDHLNLDCTFEGEMSINEEYKDSSNGIRGEMEGVTHFPMAKKYLSLSTRGLISIERYLHNRLYYTSNIKGWIEPTLVFETYGMLKQLSFGWLYGLDDYQRVDNVEDDRSRHGPQCNISLWTESITFDFDASYEFERYPVYEKEKNAYKPDKRNIARANIWSFAKLKEWLKIDLNGNYQYEQERFGLYEISLDSIVSDTINDTLIITFQLPYSDSVATMFTLNYLEIKPEITFKNTNWFGFSLGCQFEMQTLAIKAKKYLDSIKTVHPYKVYTAFVPGMEFLFETDKLFGEVGCELRLEQVTTNDNDSWELRPYAYVNYQAFSWLTIDGSMDYQFRKYAQTSSNNPTSDLSFQDTEDRGFSVTLSLGARF